MRDVMVELKQLRLHGMVGAWGETVERGGDAGLENVRWLVKRLLPAEAVDRGMRSVKHHSRPSPSFATGSSLADGLNQSTSHSCSVTDCRKTRTRRARCLPPACTW